MENAPEDAPMPETRAESQQVLLQPSGDARNSNSRAVKIAGITTLVCLLVSAQVFTAYLVFDQKEQIQGLQDNNRKLENRIAARSRVAPQKMVMPIGSLPLVDFSDDGTPKSPPKVEVPKDATPPSVEEQLRELIKDQDFPEMNQSFLANLQSVKQRASETEWKEFELWLRYWLIFQMAQKTPTTTPQPEIIFN